MAARSLVKNWDEFRVSTHSHPKVAANIITYYKGVNYGFNTQPPEGGCYWFTPFLYGRGSFNTQPPEGGCKMAPSRALKSLGFNTQPPEGGCRFLHLLALMLGKFQHTATRRWLRVITSCASVVVNMFQHTATRRWLPSTGFTPFVIIMFQHTATRRWLLSLPTIKRDWIKSFNTQPPEGGCRY